MVKRAPADYPGVTILATHKGGTAAACGTVSTSVTVPANANMAYIHAAGGAVYWNVGGTAAGTASPGYVAQDQNGVIFPIDNMGTVIYVYGGAAASIAHVEFYQE